MKLSIFFVLILANQVKMDPTFDFIMDYFVKQFFLEKIKSLDINQMCVQQIEILLNNKDILLQMVDASAKIPYAGILYSGRAELGNFDQCLAIDHNINGIKLLGKYCYAGLVIPDFTNISNIDMFYKLATCVPAACSAKDFINISSALLFENFPPIFIDDYCTTKETGKEFSTGTVIVLCIVLLLTAMVLISTMYDFYCQKMEEKPAHQLLLSFSMITNTKSILKISKRPSKDTIMIFHGFRAISIAWILAGHAAQMFANEVFTALNYDYALKVQYARKSSYIFGARFAVTTFFYMSGFLVSFIYFKKKPRHWKMQLKALPKMYLYRYIRLTASLAILYFLVLYLLDKLGNGPIWHAGCQAEINNCKKYWWSYFLYIQNYVNWDNMCLLPLWYVSADMQLYFLATLILIPISVILKRPNGFQLAMSTLGSLIILFILLNIGVRELFPKTTENDLDTHSRLPEYFVGIAIGLFMRLKNEELFLGTINRNTAEVINIAVWVGVMVTMFCLFLFAADGTMKFEGIHYTLYKVCGGVIWALGLSWMVYSCYHGCGGFINWILCRPIFQVLGKLSYTMYLLHFLIMGHYAFSNRMKWYFSHYVQFYIFCGLYIEALLVSFVWSLGIESPILIIEKHFFKGQRKKEGLPITQNNTGPSESTA